MVRAMNADASSRGSWLRRLRWPGFFLPIGTIALVALSLFVRFAVRMYQMEEASRERFQAVTDELDQFDPGWRYEQIDAKREILPDSENSALRLLTTAQNLPSSWPQRRAVRKEDESKSLSSPYSYIKIDPNLRYPGMDPWMQRMLHLESAVQLSPEQTLELRAELKELAPVLAEIRPVADMRRGRYPLSLADNPLDTLLPHVDRARALARLLKLDMILRAPGWRYRRCIELMPRRAQCGAIAGR